MGVLLQAFYFAPGRVAGVPSPLDGDASVPFWWDHLAAQAEAFAQAGFTAVWLPPALKGASGSLSSGYDVFDDYDLGSKRQKGTIPTRYGTRESLQRCVAVMRANGLDVYADLVENQRDGDDGHFNFHYADAFGNSPGGRFEKGPGDFHPHVPQDPGVFTDQFQFGRDLAPIRGLPKDHCRNGLLDAADWLARALDLQGFRLDNMKGVSTEFTTELLQHGALANKFAVGEFADGRLQLVQDWANAVQHRAAAFDFPLHFALKNMCNAADTFNMASLDHAGLAGVDPGGAVTFVENHDSDRGGLGGPVVRNKLLAYAYILTAEGYPCIFYRDYSTDKHCFGMKPDLDRLIHIHEHFAKGPTQQRWMDSGVFAYERLGGDHLLVGLNKDAAHARTITVQSGFAGGTALEDLSGHTANVTVDSDTRVTIMIPKNGNGTGFVCLAPRKSLPAVIRVSHQTTQVFEGAQDLDLKPATDGESVIAGRVFAAAGSRMALRLSIDVTHWTANSFARLGIVDPSGSGIGEAEANGAGGGATELSVTVTTSGFHSISIFSENLPPDRKNSNYKIVVRYTAPKTLH